MGYLVISRRINERIQIGDDIEILIADINDGSERVDVAIKAPKKLHIKRKDSHFEEEQDDGSKHRNKSR